MKNGAMTDPIAASSAYGRDISIRARAYVGNIAAVIARAWNVLIAPYADWSFSIHQNGAISHGKSPAPQYSTPRRAGLPVSAIAREIWAYSISSENSHGVGRLDACQT